MERVSSASVSVWEADPVEGPMRKFFYTALSAAFVASVSFDHPATAAPAGTGPKSASQSTVGATKAKQPRARRAVARRPAERTLPVPSNEESRTADLNRQSLNSQSPAVEARAAPAQDDPPLNRRLPYSLERFANPKVTKEGWTSTLGLLPQPETKVSIPSPDVRLEERGIRLGAMYRF